VIDILDTGVALIDILDTPGQEAYASVLDQLRLRYLTKSLRFFPPTALVLPLPCFIVSDVISCRPLVEQYLRVGEGFLLVYSMTSRESFEATNRLHQQILQVRDKANVPILLIGNKCDLDYERQVGMNGE
jgi:GTPase SAR1 family protein